MKFKIFLASLLLSPIMSFAAGYQYIGSVWVHENTSYKYLWGYYNNRWNTSATTAETYIHFATSNTDYITIDGRGSDGAFFSCQVNTSNSLHADAIELVHTINSSAYISIRKPATSNQCDSIYINHNSAYLQ